MFGPSPLSLRPYPSLCTPWSRECLVVPSVCRLAWLVAAALLLPPLGARAADEAGVVVTTLQGERIEGELQSLDWQSLQVGERTLAIERLESLQRAAVPAVPLGDAARVVYWTDGSTWTVQDVVREGRNVTVTRDDAEVTRPATQLRAVRLSVVGESEADDWRGLLEGDRREDVLAARQGESLRYIPCTIGAIQAEAIALRVGERDLELPRERIFGVVFAPSGPAPRPAAVHVLTADGSRLGAAAVTLQRATAGLDATASKGEAPDGESGESSQLLVSVAGQPGLTLRVPWEQVAGIDWAGGRVVRLATISPRTQYDRGEKVFSGTRPVRVGQNILGQLPTIDGTPDAAALWMHSGTTATFPLPRGASRLQATVGIDEIEDAEIAAGSVDVVVSADGRTVWEGEVPATTTTAWDVELAGARTLAIAVTGRRADGIREHLVLRGARIVTE